MDFAESLQAFAERLKTDSEGFKKVKTNKKIQYYNVACAFDIEASSFYEDLIVRPENKRAIMYAWKFAVEDVSIIGRTWEQFLLLYDEVVGLLGLSKENRLICYVHNLGYDFQFFRPYLEFDRVFALDVREPIQAVTVEGVEFRCSYKLSGYSLAKVGEHLTRHQVKKKVGDLDYSKVRAPQTPLTKKEIGYIEADVDVQIAYIREEIEDAGDITKIPLTKTGKVRNYCRNACLHTFKTHNRFDPKYSSYRKLMERLTIGSVLEYKMLRQTFMGGFTHGNHMHIKEVCEDVSSYDEASAYPYVMVSQLFPMSKGEKVAIAGKADFEENLRYYHAMFTATFENIRETFPYDHYISASKCLEKEGAEYDNGRIVMAKRITILLTNLDYDIIRRTYAWDRLTIRNFRRYKKGLLPRDFVSAILELYEKKTILKGVPDRVVEYQQSKENINGCFGMAVTDVCRPEIRYLEYLEDPESEAWTVEEADYEKALNKYNADKRRFLFYPWGIWVTAWARTFLWRAILHLGEDYRYSDTDSVKFVNLEKHRSYFEEYNKRLLTRLEKVMGILGLDFAKCAPKTEKGVKKPIGVFEYEGTYKRFKYLGAKRYLYEDQDGHLNLTVSGVNKFVAVPYLLREYKDNAGVFEAFDDGLVIPKGQTGKQVHTYIDHETQGTVRDYLGNEYPYHELSGIHMEDAEYSLSMSEEFLRYLLGVGLEVK